MSRITLCRLDALPDGSARGFDLVGDGRDTLFIVRRGDSVHAWRNACPHIDGAPMAWRKDAYLNADGSRIVCHAHGAQFDIASGVCTLGPCLGQALEPMAVRLEPAADAAVTHVVLDTSHRRTEEPDSATACAKKSGPPDHRDERDATSST